VSAIVGDKMICIRLEHAAALERAALILEEKAIPPD
jgi:hypothetical protein